MNRSVLIVAPSRSTMGGITSVVKAWMQMPTFRNRKVGWLETQSNRGVLAKIWYLVSSWLKMLFIVPRYDIIHFHSIPGICVLIHMPILLYSRLWRRKIVVHLHVGNQIAAHVDDRMFRHFIAKADKVVVLAKVWEPVMLRCGLPASKVTTIYNPAPPVVEKHLAKKQVLFLAYMTENKGYHVLLQAFARVAPKHPEWKLVMAGSGELDNVRKIAGELGILNRTDILGWVSGDDKDRLFRESSVYCMASFMEGFPVSVLEAYSYGLALVTTPVGGLVDVLEDGRNALVFDFGDVDGLASALDRLFSDEELVGTLSAASISLARELFSMEKVDSSLAALYESL